MNKYIIIGGVLVLIIVGGAVYRANFVAEVDKPVVTGVERELTIVVRENTWKFDPEFIEVDQGDKVIMTIVNRDDYDHGFAIDAYGISQRMPALGTIQLDFVATRPGDFPYYCSVSCGSGEVDGVTRGHFDQIGRLHVRSLISNTSDFGSTLSAEELKTQAVEAAIKQEANREAEKLGINVDSHTVTIDTNKSVWNQHVNNTPEDQHKSVLEALIGSEYHAVHYENKSNTTVLWVLIDAQTGEIIAHEEN